MKRIFALCLLAAMICGCALAEDNRTMAVATETYTILLRADGTQLTQRHEYADISELSYDEHAPDLFIASPPGSEKYEKAGKNNIEYVYALVNADGVRLTDFAYTSLIYFPESGVISFERDGKAGVMDETGKELIYGEYSSVMPNGEGGYIAIITSDKAPSTDNGEVAYIDERGETHATGLITYKYALHGGFSEGLYCITIFTDEGTRIGYINTHGELVIPAKFASGSQFSGGYATVAAGEDYLAGLIDASGEIVIPPTFNYIDLTPDTELPIIAETLDDKLLFIDKQTLNVKARISGMGTVYPGTLNSWIVYVSFDKETVYYDKDMKRLFIIDNANGAYLSGYYDHIDSEPERFVLNGGDWIHGEAYLIDLQGERASASFQSLNPAEWIGGEGRYVFAKFDINAAVDEDDYESVVWDSYRYGLIDQDGNIIVPAEYSMLMHIAPDRYWVKRADIYGLIDGDGKWYYSVSEYAELLD